MNYPSGKSFEPLLLSLTHRQLEACARLLPHWARVLRSSRRQK